MRVWGAIDLREGAAVQLVGGVLGSERVRVTDIDTLVARWSACFHGIHVVDLDAALGRGSNRETIRRIVSRTDGPLQLGGGLRDGDAVADALASGVARAIVGTRAVDDAAWLEAVARRFPGRIVLAADQRDGVVLRRGWTAASDLPVPALLERVAKLPLAAVLVTDVRREGGVGGVDTDAFERLTRGCAHSLIAAGGIASLDDLRALRDAGVAEAVVGMAAYTGAIVPEDVAVEFDGAAAVETSSGAEIP
ncbi:MAG TPA: HisA/HisF-related TIM barrel protein [Longimicrobiales bacterium]|nr:HisA/HisF-related TIM barrel protein [Longimicrobiales bacterium]